MDLLETNLIIHLLTFDVNFAKINVCCERGQLPVSLGLDEENKEVQMKDVERGKIMVLILAIALMFLWAVVRFAIPAPVSILIEKVSVPVWLFFETPAWLVIGVLTGSVSQKRSQHQTASMQGRLLGGLLGWLMIVILWGLSLVLPALDASDFGIGVDLNQEAPTFWAGIAFLLGYYGKVTAKIPAAAWSQGKMILLGNGSGNKQNGHLGQQFSAFWKGLKELLKRNP
jgi:hypothetical protein